MRSEEHFKMDFQLLKPKNNAVAQLLPSPGATAQAEGVAPLGPSKPVPGALAKHISLQVCIRWDSA